MLAVEAAEIFARNLRRIRQEAGISQEALGDAADMHRTEIGLLERGKREPRLGTLVKLARALDVKLAQLLDGLDLVD